MNLVMPIYQPNMKALTRHLNIWKQVPDLKINLVDDGSPNPLIINEPTLNIKVARIKQDIVWNTSGAINLAFHIADDDWIIAINEDHVIEKEVYLDIMRSSFERGHIYILRRFRPDGSSRRKNVPAISVMHRADYWKAGGYDEDFAGGRGCSDWFFLGRGPGHKETSLVKEVGIDYIQTDFKVTEHAEFNKQCVKTKIKRFNYDLHNKKLKELKAGTYKHPKVLNFDWKTVYVNTKPHR